jgi:hypothetical protein
MGFYSGPTVVNDSLVFCFDAGSDKCTDADDAVASMRDIAPVAHSSRTDRGITGTGNTGNFSFPTNTGASKAIDLSISSYNSANDADDYDNRLTLDDDLYFADEDAWSFEFWGKLNSNAVNTYQSLGGPGGTTRWIIQHKGGANSWTIRFRENDGTYRTSTTQTTSSTEWYQMMFTVAADRTMKQYINGVLISTHTLTSSTLTINRIMASYSSSTSRYGYEGVMLCCRAYAKELSATEVLKNFNATRGRVGI